MPILQDSNGMAVKFFVQKDLPEEIQADLCETITSLGGRVEAKVPRQGYILVQPGTAEEERLRLCWTSPDRPDRHFVPYTYVDACKISGMLLKQIFVENGAPILMHIHPSIANINARSTLSQRIMHSGGDPSASAQSARVILADPNTEVFNHLVKVYQGVPDKYIESYLWVKKCVEKGSLVFTPLVYKNPGGRRPGEERTQFTDADEEHLCDWIAEKIPYKETGGRTGNKLYQQLCDSSNDPEYAWVTRHTWQSWRERYKKNATRLDAMIAVIVDQKKPVPGEKGQYGYVRQAEDKPKRVRKRRAKNNPPLPPGEEGFHEVRFAEEMVGMGSGAEMAGAVVGAGMGMGMGMGMGGHVQRQQSHPGSSSPGQLMYPSGIAGPSRQGLDHLAVRGSPAEEEMDDGDETSEWAVKIGDAPPPIWGKRKLSEEATDQVGAKRARSSQVIGDETRNTTREHPTSEINQQTVIEIATLANTHVIDRGVGEIAAEFRFTVEEVKEYYDKCGEMGRTRERFRKMREELQARFNEDER